jgi:rhamnosyltransferase
VEQERIHSPVSGQTSNTENDSIASVVVTCNIGRSILNTLHNLRRQTDCIVIVDNHSEAETRELLSRFVRDYPDSSILITRNDKNLAAAQNAGIREALRRNYGWVLLMDHDSLPAEHMVQDMLAVWRKSPANERIGMLVPSLKDSNTLKSQRYLREFLYIGFRHSRLMKDTVYDDLICAIASGSLIPAKVFDSVGLMDESFVIDDVDREFCLRLRKKGFRISAVGSAILTHHIGDAKDHRYAGLRVTTSNHSAHRRYYKFRNRLRCWRKHGWYSPGFVTFDVLAMGYELLRITLLEQQKRTKLKAAFTGIYDALTGKDHSLIFAPHPLITSQQLRAA